MFSRDKIIGRVEARAIQVNLWGKHFQVPFESSTPQSLQRVALSLPPNKNRALRRGSRETTIMTQFLIMRRSTSPTTTGLKHV